MLACVAFACSSSPTPRHSASHAHPDDPRSGGACSHTLVDIAAGDFHTCAVTADGKVGCWGSNAQKQSAPASEDEVTGFSLISGVPSATQVAAGQAYSCARTATRAVYCWGRGESPKKVLPLPKAERIAVGATYACAQTRTGSAVCWDADAPEPVAISGTEKTSSLTVGQTRACVLDAKGRALCWKPGDSRASRQTAKFKDLRQLAISKFSAEIPDTDGHSTFYDWSCAVDDKRQVQCWGENLVFLAHAQGAVPKSPLAVPGLDDVASLSVSESTVCALRRDGRVACWGSMSGNGSPGPQSTQHALGLRNISTLSLGGSHACALDQAGRAHCWGYGDKYQLGNWGDQPRAVPEQSAVKDIKAGDKFACATQATGEIHCWGHLPWHQDQATTALPQKAPLESGSQFSIGLTNLCGVRPNGDVHCIGPSALIGSGTIALPQPAREVSVGELHACAVLQDGAVFCWGQGFSGQLGNGSTDDSAQPVPVPLPGPAAHVTVGRTHSCAWNDEAAHGAVWCWGENSEGQLGVGGTQNQVLPTIVALPPVLAVEAGNGATCALLSDHTVQCWGRNAEGQLGLGKLQSTDKARPIPGLTGIVQISLGDGKTCALDERGALFCWGRVEPYTPEPEQVQLSKSASRVSTSGDQTCALWSDGSVSCWHRSAKDSSLIGYGSDAWFPILSCAES